MQSDAALRYIKIGSILIVFIKDLLYLMIWYSGLPTKDGDMCWMLAG